MAYKAALANDASARGQEIAGDQKAMEQAQGNARTAIQQTGENQRAGMNVQRYDDANQIARGRLTLEQIAAGHQNRTSDHVERVQVELENAKTPEAQRSARARLMALAGKTDGNVWAHAPGGQMVDQKTQQLITVPSTICNLQSGETREQQPGHGGNTAPPPARDSLVRGQVDQTEGGPLRWNGTSFEPVG